MKVLFGLLLLVSSAAFGQTFTVTELRRLKEEALTIQEQPSPAEWPEWINEVRA